MVCIVLALVILGLTKLCVCQLKHRFVCEFTDTLWKRDLSEHYDISLLRWAYARIRFEVIGKGQNRAQCLHYNILWQIVTIYMGFFFLDL